MQRKNIRCRMLLRCGCGFGLVDAIPVETASIATAGSSGDADDHGN